MGPGWAKLSDEALSREEGVGIPAGEATELGTMKSSKFMGSLGVSAEASMDRRRRAMPPGALVDSNDRESLLEESAEVERLACFALAPC